MNRVIFPLDGMDERAAREWAYLLEDSVAFFKIGLELFTRCGPEIIEKLDLNPENVMLDLKLKDIPGTMVGATRAAVDLGVALLTVHADAGPDALEACVKATEKSFTRIIAVTVLTSLDEDFIRTIFRPGLPGEHTRDIVNRLTRMAYDDAGVRHFVCSPNEARLIRTTYSDAVVITPGVRLEGGNKDDQKRVNTPRFAARMGADFCVVGRPIRDADNPEDVIRHINREFEIGVGERCAQI